jgi:hypothetical protein
MGTLSHQVPRTTFLDKGRVEAFARKIKEIAKETDITYKEALETYKTVALIDDYDIKDEQLAGFGDLAQELINAINLGDK